MARRDHRQLEDARLIEQVRLDALKSLANRNKLGQFATPPGLAKAIAEYAVGLFEKSPIHFADPAIGTGSFFSALLTAVPKGRIKSATGVEIDGAFAEAARGLWSGSGLRLIEGDFTQTEIRGMTETRPNFILTNPPYVRHHHIDGENKARLGAAASRVAGLKVSGLAGLYVYFFLLATDWMQDDGLAVWLIPSEFMDVNYGSTLRTYLTEKVTLIRIHRFDPEDVQFSDALVTSAIVVFRKRTPTGGETAEFTYGGSLIEPEHRENVPFELLSRAPKWGRFPARQAGLAHQERRGMGIVLADLFRIRRGLATGDNDFFILPHEEALARSLPREFLKPILPAPRHLGQTIVVEDSGNGFPSLPNPLSLIDCPLPEEIVRERYPSLWEYLQEGQRRGVRERYLVKHRAPWYKQEQRDIPLFLSTYMGRGVGEKQPFRFIWNRSKAIAANVYLLLYPRPPLMQLLKDSPDNQLLAFRVLQGYTAQDLRDGGRVYGGGLHKMEPAELGGMSAALFLESFPKLSAANLQREKSMRVSVNRHGSEQVLLVVDRDGTVS